MLIVNGFWFTDLDFCLLHTAAPKTPATCLRWGVQGLFAKQDTQRPWGDHMLLGLQPNRGTSLTRKRPPPQDLPKTLGIGLR